MYPPFNSSTDAILLFLLGNKLISCVVKMQFIVMKNIFIKDTTLILFDGNFSE